MTNAERSVMKGYLEDALQTFTAYKRLSEKAMAQVNDEEFFRRGSDEVNSIALIVKHIAGNQWSRWRNFLTEDGEKPDRHRDTEFEYLEESRDQLLEAWERGWSALFGSVGALNEEDLARTVFIRGESHSVVQAINRQLTHYAYHVGQIVLLAKEVRGSDWKSLSVPRNKSDEFNAFISARVESGDAKKHPLEGPGEFAESEGGRSSKG